MNPGQIIFDGSMFLAVAIAIAAGLVSFLSPCVLPLVPGYLGVLSGMAPGESRVAVPAGGGGAGAAAGAGSNVGATLATATGVGRGRLIAGVLLFIGGFTVVFVTINLAVDLLYPVLDARLRRSGSGRGASKRDVAFVDAPMETAAIDGSALDTIAPSNGQPNEPSNRPSSSQDSIGGTR